MNYISKFGLPFLALAMLLSISCRGGDSEDLESQQVANLVEQNDPHSYVVVEEGQYISVSGSEFQVRTDNCGSSLTAKETLSRTRSFEIKLVADVTSSLGGEFDGNLVIAGAKVQTAIETSFGIQVGATETVATGRDLVTPAGHISIFTMQWEEAWDTGKVNIFDDSGNLKGSVPFRLLTTLNLTQKAVEEIPCSGETPAVGSDALAIPVKDTTTTPESSIETITPTRAPATATPSPTSVPPTLTLSPTAIPSTHTPYPTTVPATPTHTPAPQITSSDSTLQIGETWRLADRAITLERCEFKETGGSSSRPYLKCTFRFDNFSSSQIFFQVDSNNFASRTNTGVEDQPWSNAFFVPYYSGEQLSVGAGSYAYLKTVPFVVDYFDPSITSVRIFARNVGSIPQAVWEIGISH